MLSTQNLLMLDISRKVFVQHSKFPKWYHDILLLRTKILIRIIILMVILSRRIEVLETRLNKRENSCGKNALHLNTLRRISISGSLATRTGNSFLKNENSFQQAMRQRVLLERIFNRKSYKQNRNFSNSYHKNPEIIFSRTRILSGRQRSRRFF